MYMCARVYRNQKAWVVNAEDKQMEKISIHATAMAGFVKLWLN